MSGAGFEDGLKRASRKESNTQKQGRSGGGTPKMGLKGDSNPTRGGGINRSTKGK